jgi:DNA-binding PucR family transcriptional regulator
MLTTMTMSDEPSKDRHAPSSIRREPRERSRLIFPRRSRSAWLEQETVDSLVQLVRSLPDFERMVGDVVQTVTALFQAEKAGIMLWDTEAQELVLQQPAFGVSSPEIINQYRVRLADGGNAIRVFTTGQPYLSNDCPNDPQIIQKYVDLFGSRSVMTVPLRVDGQIIGVLHVTNKRQGGFTEHELRLLERVADSLAVLIDNARLFQVIRRNEQEADTLYHLSLQLTALLEPKEILSLALPTVASLLDAVVAGAHLHSGIDCIYDREMGWDIPGWEPLASLWREALASYQTIRLSLDGSYPGAPPSHWQKLLSAQGLLELLLVPLVSGESLGLLFVARRHHLPFTQADERLLARLALVVSSAIRNSELQRRTELALQELRSSHESMKRVWDIHEKLTEMVLRGAGLPELTGAIAALVANPVLLEDRYGAVLSWAAPPDWSGPQPVSLAQLARRHRQIARQIKEISQLNRPTRLPMVPGEDIARLVAPITVGNETLAILSVPEMLRTLGDLDLLAVQSGATVVALALMRERAILETERRLQSDLLGDILMGKFGHEEDLARRARSLGYDLQHAHILLVVSTDAFGRTPKLREREAELQRIKQDLYNLVRTCLEPQVPQWLIRASKTHVVALVAVNPDNPHPAIEAARRLQRSAQRELPDTAVVIGVSRLCRSIQEVPSAYAEVQRFLKLRRAMGWSDGLLLVERLGLYRVLLQHQEVAPGLIQFAADRLSCLQQYDQEHDSNLIACLRAYLAAGGEIKETARALSVHRNSVRYKLQRIAEIAQVDLSDPEVRFQLQLALKIIDVQLALK